MIKKELEIPFYARMTLFLIGIFVFLSMLYIAQAIIVPLVFSLLIAILLNPVVNFLVRKRVNRVLAIVIALLLTFLVFAGFAAFLFSQVSRFTESGPLLAEKFTELINQAITWASGYFDIDPTSIKEWIAKTRSELVNSSGSVIGKTLVTVGGALVIVFLLPLYVFLLLFYQPLLLDFIHRLFAEKHQNKVNEIVGQTKTVVQRYLIGLLIEASIIATLQSVTLLILGIQYAILLGIIGALLNLIPYIGGLVAVALPMMIAILTKDSAWYALYVLGAYYFIQLVDNNYIVPKIVASKVRINALFSIIVVIAGNALWGVPGMFLAIPLIAIVKVIFDHIESLKPWGFLLGDAMPSQFKIPRILQRNKKNPK